eukprot:1750575-Pleurochrysis_carterae.AAC.1
MEADDIACATISRLSLVVRLCCCGCRYVSGDVRYVQAALGTPRERRQRMRSLAIGQIYRKPLKVYDGERADFCPPFSAAWSNHYAMHGRQPSNVEPAPWVRARRKAS